MTTRFSANLGYLWQELPLPQAIHAARDAGFDAVECHWPYRHDPDDIKQALDETGLAMLGLNTAPGRAGELGLSALPDRRDQARALIDQAIDYAVRIGARHVHVMAGRTVGFAARARYLANLRYAACRAGAHGLTILIEPLNHYDAPGYFLQTTDEARSVIDAVARDNLKLMFDCYHVQIMEGDVGRRLEKLMPLIGHIQFASVPDRGPPDRGELSYRHIFGLIRELGYQAPLGAEYRPDGPVEASLSWMQTLRD